MDSATESSKNSRMKNEQSDFDVHYGGEILRGVIHERLRKRNEIQSTCCYNSKLLDEVRRLNDQLLEFRRRQIPEMNELTEALEHTKIRNSELERQLNAMISNQKSSSAVKVDGKDENVSKARQGSSFLTPNVHEFLGYIPGSLWIQRNLTQNQPEVIEEKTITSLNTSTSESNSDGRVSMFVDDKSWTSMLQSKGQEFSKE